jgi:ribulose kinase
MIPKALWLSRHEPHVWAQAVRIGEYQDFLTHRLTGRWAASRNNQTMRWHFQTDHGGAPDSLVAAADLPPGAEGLLAVDHFQGNRTPHTDALARGAITGLSLKHTPAHVYRALIESVCLGTRTIVESFGDAFHPRRIVACGGTTRSPFWLQVHADTLGLPLELPEVTDAAALGSAILAAVGAGRFGSIEEAARAMVRISRTIEPDPAAHAAYGPIHARYKAAYEALKPLREAQ